MSVEQNKTIARHFFVAQDLRKGPLDETICAADYTASIAGFPAMDCAGHSQFGAAFYQGFPDMVHTINATFGEDDKVTVQFTLHGTHTGDFMGIPPTGTQVTVAAVAILGFVDGKVAQLQAVFDQMGLMGQLGLRPA